MREMKDSGIEWIGQIPERWQLRRAKTLFTQRNSKGNKVEVLLSPTQKYGVVPQSQLEGVVQVKEDTDLQMFKTIHKGDFVISLRSFQGGFEYSLYEGVCSPAYQVFYPITPICDLYYRYLFKSQSFISKMNNITVGIREGKNIQYIDFANSQIPVPPIAEQERIAAFLDAECAEIDAVLEKTRASIEEYKKLKQAVITQAVTKGVCGDRPMKDSGIEWIGEIPESWEVSSVRYIGQLQNGISKGGEFFGKGFPFVSYGDVYKNYELPHSISGLIDTTEDERATYSVEYGDIFFTRTSETIEEVGFSCVCKRSIPNATFAGFIIRLRPFCADEKILTDYAKYYFRGEHIRAYLVKEMNLVTRASLGQTLLKGMSVIVPPKSVQKEIAEYLDDKCADIDALVAKKQQYLTEIENYKKSLIYEYVTGKKEVV